jgi:hypothetical protein
MALISLLRMIIYQIIFTIFCKFYVAVAALVVIHYSNGIFLCSLAMWLERRIFKQRHVFVFCVLTIFTSAAVDTKHDKSEDQVYHTHFTLRSLFELKLSTINHLSELTFETTLEFYN